MSIFFSFSFSSLHLSGMLQWFCLSDDVAMSYFQQTCFQIHGIQVHSFLNYFKNNLISKDFPNPCSWRDLPICYQILLHMWCGSPKGGNGSTLPMQRNLSHSKSHAIFDLDSLVFSFGSRNSFHFKSPIVCQATEVLLLINWFYEFSTRWMQEITLSLNHPPSSKQWDTFSFILLFSSWYSQDS